MPRNPRERVMLNFEEERSIVDYLDTEMDTECVISSHRSPRRSLIFSKFEAQTHAKSSLCEADTIIDVKCTIFSQ